MPAHSASNVSTFGMRRLTEKPDRRRTRMRGRRTRTLRGRIAKKVLLIARGPRRGSYTKTAQRGARPRSVGKPANRRRHGEPIGKNRLAANHALSQRDLWDIGRRAVDIDPRAEADNADALANRQRLAFIEAAHNAARHEPGDQHTGYCGPVFGQDAERQPLIVVARLVEARVDKAALRVAPRPELAADRRAGDMHIKQVKEDADPRQRFGAHLELRWRRCWPERDDDAIRRADDQPGAGRRHPPGITEEIHEPQREDQRDPAERRPNDKQDQHEDRRDPDEFPAVWVDRREDLPEHQRQLKALPRGGEGFSRLTGLRGARPRSAGRPSTARPRSPASTAAR